MVKNLRLFLVALMAMVGINVMAEAIEVTFEPTDFPATTSADFSAEKDGVTVSVTASTATNEQIRIFKGQKITVSSTVGSISKAVFTCTANGETKYGPGCFKGDGYTFSAEKDGTWEGYATSFTLTAETNQVRVTKLVVTIGGESPSTVTAPTLSVPGGMYFETQTVAMDCEEGARILYTIPNGTDPEYTDEENYTGVFYDGNPLTISKTTTIKAMAVKNGKTSSIVTATYTIINTENPGTAENPFSIADALTVINALADGGTTDNAVYTKGIVVGDVTVNSNQAQFMIGATANATENLITVYKAKGLENENYIEGDVKAGDEVVICAKLQKYVKESIVTPETQYGYIYSINGQTSKSDPTLTGDGTEANPFTANDLLIMKTSQRPTDAVWVKGIIRGTYKNRTTLDTDKATNIAIAASAEATEFVPVELKSNTEYRAKLNVLDNASNKGKEVLLKGTITDYFSTTGIKNVVEAIIDGQIITGITNVKANNFQGAIYNLKGQRISVPAKGLFIKDGKKFFVK